MTTMNPNNVTECITECSICIEPFDKKRKPITCYCGFICCSSCSATYILGEKQKPKCMSCKQEWGRKFVVDNFSKTFVKNEYTGLIRDILFDTETALLPATQPFVEKKLKIEGLERGRLEIQKERLKIQTEVDKLYKKETDVINEIRKLQNKTETERREFVRKCPNQTCNGFLSTSLKCELCHIHACSKCREIMPPDSEHTCCPNILANIRMMENNTKACPKCASMIFKIDGCNQMFCTICHTAFSWTTLEIQTKNIHNPHYFHWLQTQEPQQGDQGQTADLNLGCQITSQFSLQLKKRLKQNLDPNENLIYEICRNILHIQDIEYTRFTTHYNDNLYLRARYLMNKISKEEFKKQVQRNDKGVEKKNEIRTLLTMYVDCMRNILHRLYLDVTMINSVLSEMNELKKYVNGCFKDISKYYGCVEYSINDEFKFVSLNVVKKEQKPAAVPAPAVPTTV